jgi:error-prone DNA polymerase
MQMAMAVGGCSGEDADLLRRAMGSKRGVEKISSLRATLYEGMAGNGITGDLADEIYEKIEAFANFGFAESHSISFALLVYASAWLKLHYPGAFLAALLRAQPMGFYSPQSLVADARRHGVVVLRPDVLRSGVDAVLEPVTAGPAGRPGRAGCLDHAQPAVPEYDRSLPVDDRGHRRDGAFAVRLGLADVRAIGPAVAERMVRERDRFGPFASMNDLARRAGLSTEQLESLATAGAFEGLGLERRQALWSAGEAAQDTDAHLRGSFDTVQPPLLALMTPVEQVAYDLWATGVSTDDHPIRHARAALTERGALAANQLAGTENGRRVEVGGVVTHRQRPATANGVTFMNLEDETGNVNVVVSVGVWTHFRRIARESPALMIRGILERSPEGVVNLIADRFEPLTVAAHTPSRDFR